MTVVLRCVFVVVLLEVSRSLPPRRPKVALCLRPVLLLRERPMQSALTIQNGLCCFGVTVLQPIPGQRSMEGGWFR